MLGENFNDTLLYHDGANHSAFDILKYAEEHKDWYEHCMDVLESHKLTLNTSESSEDNNDSSISLTQHFNQPTDSMCQQLVEFTASTVSVFGDSTRKTMITVYSLLIVLGILSNCSVCYVVIRNSQARTARNLFIINMAFSDLTVCLITMPLTMQKLIHHTWKYGETMCRLTSVMEGVNLLVSSGTASAIAADRLCMVKRKTARKDDTKKKNIAAIILLIWILSVLAVLPIAFFTGIFIFNFVDTPLVMKEICMEMWPAPSLHLTYSVLLMCVQFIIPITVILVTHTKIIGIVRQRTQSASSFRNANRAEVTIRKNKKTTQILLIIAGMFGIHWLPYHIYTIVSQIILIVDADLKLDSHGELLSFFFVHTWAMLSTFTNPILYGWLNTNLKHLFRAMIPTVKNERNENEETMNEKFNGNVILKDESTSIFRRVEKSLQKHFSWYGNSIEEDKEFVELADTGDAEGLTRVSLVNHSPESNHTATTESNAMAGSSSQGSSKKRPPSGLNNHNGFLESVNLDKSNVNDIEVVEVETMETIC